MSAVSDKVPVTKGVGGGAGTTGVLLGAAVPASALDAAARLRTKAVCNDVSVVLFIGMRCVLSRFKLTR